MAIFDPTRVLVLLNGVPVGDWADGSDVISAVRNGDVGTPTYGADGGMIFVRNPNQGGVLTIKLKQHSPDNKMLSDLFEIQDSDFGNSEPLSLEIKDMLNGDTVSAQGGRFTTPTAYTRGDGHNAQEWKIVFGKMKIKLKKGI